MDLAEKYTFQQTSLSLFYIYNDTTDYDLLQVISRKNTDKNYLAERYTFRQILSLPEQKGGMLAGLVIRAGLSGNTWANHRKRWDAKLWELKQRNHYGAKLVRLLEKSANRLKGRDAKLIGAKAL